MDPNKGSYIDKFFAHMQSNGRDVSYFSQRDLVCEFFAWMQDRNMVKSQKEIDQNLWRTRGADYVNKVLRPRG